MPWIKNVYYFLLFYIYTRRYNNACGRFLLLFTQWAWPGQDSLLVVATQVSALFHVLLPKETVVPPPRAGKWHNLVTTSLKFEISQLPSLIAEPKWTYFLRSEDIIHFFVLVIWYHIHMTVLFQKKKKKNHDSSSTHNFHVAYIVWSNVLKHFSFDWYLVEQVTATHGQEMCIFGVGGQFWSALRANIDSNSKSKKSRVKWSANCQPLVDLVCLKT